MAGVPKIPSMNYSNMIEEKNLKKTFIIATLISTIIGTFTTGLNLHERVTEKRNQKKTDKGQDEKIKELEKKIEDSQKQKQGPQRGDTDLRESLQYGGPMVRREYDRDFARLGPRFAEGDCMSSATSEKVFVLTAMMYSLDADPVAKPSHHSTGNCYRSPRECFVHRKT